MSSNLSLRMTLSSKKLKCKKCCYECLSEITFKNHPCDKNIKKMQSCTIKIPTLDITQSSTSNLQYFECTRCRKTFFNVTSFKDHMQTIHNAVSPVMGSFKNLTVYNSFCDPTVQIKKENISPEDKGYSSEGLQNSNNATLNTGTPMTDPVATPPDRSAQVPLIENARSVNPQRECGPNRRARLSNIQASESVGRSHVQGLEYFFLSINECTCGRPTLDEDVKPCLSCLNKTIKQELENLNVDDVPAEVHLDLQFAEDNRAQSPLVRVPPIPTPPSSRENLSSGSVDNHSNIQSHSSQESAHERNPSPLVGEHALSNSEGEECAEDNLSIDDAPDDVNLDLGLQFAGENLTNFPVVRDVPPVSSSREKPSSGLVNNHSNVQSHSSQKSPQEKNPFSLVDDNSNSVTSRDINRVENPSLDIDCIASCSGNTNPVANSSGDIDCFPSSSADINHFANPTGDIDCIASSSGDINPVASPSGDINCVANHSGNIDFISSSSGDINCVDNSSGDFNCDASPSGDINHIANPSGNIHCISRPTGGIDSNKRPSSNIDSIAELLSGKSCRTQPSSDTLCNVGPSSDLDCNTKPSGDLNCDAESSFLINSNKSLLDNNDGNAQPSGNITSDVGPSSDISCNVKLSATIKYNAKLSGDILCNQEPSKIIFGAPKRPKQFRLVTKYKTQSADISCNKANSLGIQCNKTQSVINDCSAIPSSNFNYKATTLPDYCSNSLVSCEYHCNAESADADCSSRLSPTTSEDIGKDEILIDSPQLVEFCTSNKKYTSQEEFQADIIKNFSILTRTIMAYEGLTEPPNNSSLIDTEPGLISGEPRPMEDSSLQKTVLMPVAEPDPVSEEPRPMELDSSSQTTVPFAKLDPVSEERRPVEQNSSLQNTLPVLVEEALVPVSEELKPIQRDSSQKAVLMPTDDVLGSGKPWPMTAESSEQNAVPMPSHNTHEAVSGEPKLMTVNEFSTQVPTVRTSFITWGPLEADALAVVSSHDDKKVLRYICSHCLWDFQLDSLDDHLCSVHDKPANVEIKVHYLRDAEGYD